MTDSTNDWYADDDDQDGENDGSDGRRNPVRDQRNQIRKLQKDLKAAQKEAEELKQFKLEFESSKRFEATKSIFEDMGLNEKQAKLFTQLNPDTEVTEQAVEEFATDVLGFEVQYVDEDGEPTDPPEPDGFAPTPTIGERTGARQMTRVEWLNLAGRDPVAGQAALKAGKVDLSEVDSLKQGPA